jgi:hypothetical protein
MQRLQARLLLLSAVGVVLGSLLPWHHVTGLGHNLNIDGIDSPNNGLITLGLGLALGVVAWRMIEQRNHPRRTVLALTVVTAVASVWALIDASSAGHSFTAPAHLSRTYGQWVLLAGALAALAVGVLMARPDKPESAGPTNS